jgi:hypothetical protein
MFLVDCGVTCDEALAFPSKLHSAVRDTVASVVGADAGLTRCAEDA